MSKITICVIGHSTMSVERFVRILLAHSITILVDIRKIPRSSHNPQFNSDALEKSLNEAGIGYIHLKELGGLRRPLKDSENTGWRNASFRGYADYMQTEEFERALNNLLKMAKSGRVAIMCAEGNPYRCHRSLVADALLTKGVKVMHISSRKTGRPHRMTPFAEIVNGRILYPAASEMRLSGAHAKNESRSRLPSPRRSRPG